MTDRNPITTGPLTGAALMAHLNEQLDALWNVSAIPLTSVGGTGNAVTASMDPPLKSGGALVTGMKFGITWGADNTGAVTLAINGAAAQAVQDATGAALTGGALVAGTRALLEWVGSAFRVIGGGAASGNTAGPSVQVFTASATWTKPTGYGDDAMVLIEAWGAGGGGARNTTTSGGGGGGGYSRREIRFADLPSSLTITIGAGGLGATATGSGGNGGNTTVGSILTAYGGAGGTSNGGGGGGGEVSAGSGVVGGLIGGGNGGGGTTVDTSARSVFGGGAGGNAAVATNPGGAAVYGGGGGGGGAATTTAIPGGVSIHGGNGGTGGDASPLPTSGQAPGGGGGGGSAANGGNGARGEVRIWIMG